MNEEKEPLFHAIVDLQDRFIVVAQRFSLVLMMVEETERDAIIEMIAWANLSIEMLRTMRKAMDNHPESEELQAYREAVEEQTHSLKPVEEKLQAQLMQFSRIKPEKMS